MSFNHADFAYRQRENLTLLTKMVLMMLSHRADERTGECYPSLKTICSDCIASRPAVIKAIKELERLGFIKVIREKQEGKRDKVNKYVILINRVGNPSLPLMVNDVAPIGLTTFTQISNIEQVNINKGKFVAPTLEQILEVGREKGYSEKDCKSCFSYYSKLDWHRANGDKVKNWKIALGQWMFRASESKEKTDDKSVNPYLTMKNSFNRVE